MRSLGIAAHTTLLLFIMLAIMSCQSKTDKQEKYNVLLISVDDLRTELNCYGAEHIKSPNIDRLASSGVRFTQAHVQQAICMASRASILTGLRPETREIYSGKSVNDLVPDVTTLNQVFENNGYNIAASGKIYHYQSDTKIQFGENNMIPAKTWSGRGYVTDEAMEQKALNIENSRGPAYEHADVHDTLYEDGINTLNAIRKLEKLKESDKPFFLAFGFKKPHLPFVAPQKYWDMYPESSITMPDIRQMPVNSNKYTMRVRGELTNYYGIPENYSEISDSTTTNLRRAYYSCVSFVDAQIGLLLDQLDDLGLRENTIIVLWGDHGYKLGDYGNWCKWSNMNIDTNIPFIWSVPNGKSGEICNTPVEALDIYPTLVELCGLKKPEHLQGQSIVYNLNNPADEQARFVGTVWPQNRREFDNTIMGYSIKSPQYNYVEWVKLSTGKILETELYDRIIDPQETKNIVADEQYSEVVQMLAEKAKERQDRFEVK